MRVFAKGLRPLWRYSPIAPRWSAEVRRASYRSLTSMACEAQEYVTRIRHGLPTIAQRMLDEGVLQRCDPTVRSPSGREVLNSYLRQCRNAEERQEAVVCFSFLVNRYRMALVCCDECLYRKKRCICDSVKKAVPRNKLWLFQHVGEYGRNNNTGSLLCLVAGAERTIRGIREQQEKMLDHIHRNRSSTIILFPNSDSMTLDEYRQERVTNMGSDDVDPLTLVLLDGTSRQAKNFDRFMPADIPRVRLRETSVRSWLDPIRRQTEEHRVCTAQAAAMILDELGDREASQAIQNAVRSMLRFAEVNRYAVPFQSRMEKRHQPKLWSSRCHAT